MNIYYIILSRFYLKGHRRAKQETGFVKKTIEGIKIHTIRKNYKYWKKRIDAIKARKGILSLRFWTSAPYKSPQEEFMKLPYADIQRIDIINKNVYIDGKLLNIGQTMELAKNDGFDFSPGGLNDFYEWLGADKKDIKDAGIIHFTKFLYNV